MKGLHVTNCKCEKEQKIPELLLRFKLQDILNSTYSTISIVAQMAAAEKFNKVYDLPPIIEENEDVDFIGVEEKNIEVVMSHANVDRGTLCIFGGRIRTKNEKKRIFNKLRFF